jgi:hypothetical protein
LRLTVLVETAFLKLRIDKTAVTVLSNLKTLEVKKIGQTQKRSKMMEL